MVTLSSHNLVVMLAKVESIASPSIEVIRHGHATTNTLGSTDRPILLKGPCAVDGRLIGPSRNVDVVGTAIGRDAALVLGAAAWVVGTIGLNDVVFNQRVASPAVDSEVPVTARVEGAAVVDGANRLATSGAGKKHLPASAWVPSLATNEVASVPPVHRVAATLAHCERGLATTIGPPRIKVAIVVALRVGSSLALLKNFGRVAVIPLVEKVKRSGKYASGSGQSEKKRLE